MPSASLTEDPPMQTMPNAPSAEAPQFSPAALLVRHRTWVYAMLLLLAAVLLFADQRRGVSAGQFETRVSAASSTNPPAAQPATQEDRPLLTPDR
jgi:hypothetical protein